MNKKIKPGDRVRIREWDDLEKEYGIGRDGDIPCPGLFSKSMRPLCGKMATVVKIAPECLALEFDTELAAEDADGYVFTKQMVTVCQDEPESEPENEPENNIRIKYFTDKVDKLCFTDGEKSDWIDLRAAEDISLKKGEFALIRLGVAMQLPEGYEAHIVPRSSTFKKFGVIQTNHMGVIDESYCGDNDEWRFPALAIRDTEIHVNDRICQFRIMKKQPRVTFTEVGMLGNEDRGGFGSTGTN